MTSPWLLVAAGGVTVGALFGLPGIVLWTAGTAIAALPGGRHWAALAVVAAIAAALGAARTASETAPIVSPEVLESVAAEGAVATVPQTGPSGPRAVIRVERVADEGGSWTDARGEVLVLFRDHAPDDLAQGDRLRLRWSVTGLAEHEPGFRRFVRSSGAGASASVFQVRVVARGQSATGLLVHLRDRVTERIQAAIPGDPGALLAGFVTGDDSGLSASTRQAFERTNMSHITAVSGSNVAVLLTMWLVVMPGQRLRRSLPALIAISLVIWLYVLLVGMGAGAVRAGLFATIMLPAARMGRRADPLSALLLASALMLLARPGFADNAGFWLSLAASTAMVTCALPRRASPSGLLLSGLAALVAAQVATLPITVWVFGGWSPASLAANLLVGPIVTALFPVAFVTALLVTVLPWVGALIAWLPALVATVIIAIVDSLAIDFPMLGAGGSTSAAVAPIAALALVVIGAMSGDVRRWLRRVEWSRPIAARVAVPVALGAAAGAWIGTLVHALLR